MSLTSIITGPKRASIGAITLDASISETHNVSWTVTKHPVETGSEISDHKRLQPLTISMTDEISDVPMQLLAIPDPQRSIDAWKELEEAARGDLVTVVTTLKQYKDMQIESLRATRTAATGEVLAFVATLRQILTVDSAQAKRKAPQGNRNRGKRAKKTSSTKQAETVAAKLLL
jgi:hypothetical protein